MRYYPHDIAAYMAATVHLTNGQDLAYFRLLQIYYLKEEPLPLDEKYLARKVRCPLKDVVTVLEEFFERTENGWRNKRCDEEISRYRARSEKARTSALMRHNPLNLQKLDDANAERTQSDCTATAMRSPAKEKEENIKEEKRKEKENKEKDTSSPSPRASGFLAKNIPCPPDIPEDVWKEFLVQCKAKGKPVTERVWKKIVEEAQAAKISPQVALIWCIGKGYARFEAEWWLKENPPRHETTPEEKEAAERERKRFVEELIRRWNKEHGVE